jgi:alginate O-acetyltransferase complex protein AlgI
MLFNSISFAIFLPIVFLFYWFVTNRSFSAQNLILLVSSYFFYAYWDYRFLFLLMFSTLLDFFTGIKMSESSGQNRKRFWFWLSVIINLGFLGIFKYYNFFAVSFANALSKVGIKANFWTLQVILPVGISFYTFHGLSYVIDIYNDRIKPVRNFVEYAVFVSFFPLLVAGPIERATHLLPQIQRKRKFEYAKAIDGLRQILWGLFKKIVIADNVANYVNIIFNNSSHYGGSTLLLGAIFFAFQIYCDFSGYSDIAIGTAKLFGIDLLRNFAFPYFSRDIAEFWRRWHISLSSWFRDYLYIPLGGSKSGRLKSVRNIFIIFIVSGFWHGANWTFIAWGALNALYFLPLLLLKRNRQNMEIVAAGNRWPSLNDFFKILLTFSLTVFAWIFFRSESISKAFSIIRKIFSFSIFMKPQGDAFLATFQPLIIFSLVGVFLMLEWVGREGQYAISFIGKRWPGPIKWAFYYSLIFSIFYFAGEKREFIYFQF